MKLGAALLGLLLPAAQSLAEEVPCRLGKARYVQAESSYVIEFLPTPHDASTSLSNRFSVRGFEGGQVLSGEVVRMNGYGGPWATITRQCPLGTEQGSGEACTLWAGLIYVLGQERAEPLPRETEPPPNVLLFPNFGRTIYGASLNKGNIPGDVFELEGCGR